MLAGDRDASLNVLQVQLVAMIRYFQAGRIGITIVRNYSVSQFLRLADTRNLEGPRTHDHQRVAHSFDSRSHLFLGSPFQNKGGQALPTASVHEFPARR